MSIASRDSRPPVPPKPTHWPSSSGSAGTSPTESTRAASSAVAARAPQHSPELFHSGVSRVAINASNSESHSSQVPPTDDISPLLSQRQYGRASASESALATQLTLNALLNEVQRVAGREPNEAGVPDGDVSGTYWGISPVRRTFMLIVVFDLLFTFLLWLICTQVCHKKRPNFRR